MPTTNEPATPRPPRSTRCPQCGKVFSGPTMTKAKAAMQSHLFAAPIGHQREQPKAGTLEAAEAYIDSLDRRAARAEHPEEK